MKRFIQEILDGYYVGYVYRWKNRINGMMYIGAHKGYVDDSYFGRYIGGGAEAGGKTKFSEAVEEYGRNNFEVEILELVYGEEKNIWKAENFYLEKYDVANDPEYHNEVGAKDGKKIHSAQSLMKLSEARKDKTYEEIYGIEKAKEVKKKQSEARKDKPQSEEHRKNMGKVRKGRRWVNDGKEEKSILPNQIKEYLDIGWVMGRKKNMSEGSKKYWSDLENRKKQSERMKGKSKGVNSALAKAITFRGKQYGSYSACSRDTGLSWYKIKKELKE